MHKYLLILFPNDNYQIHFIKLVWEDLGKNNI